jgi:hypothetical protein
MSFSNADVYKWAQEALDKYNGGYRADEILSNAVVYLYRIRNEGNADAALATASHYLHCRYVSSCGYVAGAMIGFIMAMAYDGAVKAVDTLIKKYSSKELVYQFGKAPTSSFSPLMLAWDLQGLSDGVKDFMTCFGNTTLTASRFPLSAFYIK